jgi:glycerol-3-phosphate acyltransferase PlsX
MQGNDVTKEAFKLLKASGLNFRGNIAGHDLFAKPAEVVVCDGFTGNVVLKTTEAVAHAILSWLKHELCRNPVRKLGAKLAEGAFKSIRKKTNYEEYGGMKSLMASISGYSELSNSHDAESIRSGNRHEPILGISVHSSSR